MLTWEFPPRIIGGISTHVYDLSQALVKKGVSVHVLTCDFPKAPEEENVGGVHVTRVDSGGISQSNFHLWVYHLNSQLIKRAATLVEQEKFDIIHAHDWLVGRAAIELKARYDLPLVTTIHATEMGRGGAPDDSYRRKIHATERVLTENSEKVICCSNFMVHHLQEILGTHANRIHVIPNGVDPSRFEERSLQTVPNGSSLEHNGTVLFVGRLVREKGVSILLEAIKDLIDQGSRANLLVVGDGPLRENLTEEALKLGIHESVRFTGFVDSPTLVSSYKSSDICVVPSLHEPFGMVALEAMAAGTPTIVSDVGGLSEIVDDEVTGLKVPPGDDRLLADAIRRLLEDPELAEQLRQNANNHVRDLYRWDTIAESTISVYNRAHVQTRIPTSIVPDADLLGDEDLLQYLHATGATRKDTAKSAKEIASAIGAPEFPIKLVLGRTVASGYVSTTLGDQLSGVRYHLNAAGIVRTCSDFS